MARKKYITRTVKGRHVKGVQIDPSTHELTECDLTVPYDENVREYVEQLTGKVLLNYDESVVESTYFMDLDYFLKNAQLRGYKNEVTV